MALSLSACAGSNGKKDDAQTQGKRLPAYFEEIPADTFYFAGGSEPVPRELVETSLKTIDTLRQWTEMFENEVESTRWSQELDVQPAMAVARPEDAAAEFFELLVEQMGGEISAEGLEAMGISASPHLASYSVGTVPVIRVGLSDPAKFSAFIDRLDETYERSPAVLEHAGESYRRYENPNAETLVLVRTTEDEAIFAAPEKRVFELFVPYFVGAKKPAKSLADDNAFVRTVEAHGFERFGAAYLDLEKLMGFSTGTVEPEGITARILAASDFEMDASQECKREYMHLVRKMPRLVAGFRHFDENTTDVAVGAEFDDAIARGLAETVSGAPGHNTAFAEKSLFQIGLGIDVGKMMDFMVEQAREIQTQPFQCQELAHLNQSASELIRRSAQVPPVISQLAGFNLLVRNLLLEWTSDSSASGTTIVIPRVVAALRTDQPEAFMFLVSRFFPMAGQLQAKPDGNPVPIPQAAGVYEGIIDPSLLMTQKGLAITVGPKMVEDTRNVLDAEENATSPAFIARLNLGDPAREILDNLETIIDKAEADKSARGLADADIAGARRAVATLERFLPDAAWAATSTVEFNDFGMLLSYRDQGALDFDPDQIPDEADEADFDALERVLGLAAEDPMMNDGVDEVTNESL